MTKEDINKNPEDDFLWKKLKETVRPLRKNQKSKYEKDNSLNKQNLNTKAGENFYSRNTHTNIDHKPVRKNRKEVRNIQNLNHIKSVRSGNIKIEYTLDLHGLTQNEAYNRLTSIIKKTCFQGR